MTNCKILVVDDEHDIADLLEVYLQNENYIVYKFYSAKDALTCIEQEELDLAILDIMLPDISGFSICQKIRETHTYPIIMLTAKYEETDKITGLTLGADDYVTKPFRPLELIARVKAQLRRYKKYSPTPIEERKTNVLLTYDKLQLNTQTYECLLDGENVALTPTEFSILRILLEHKGTVVTVEDLFCSVWKDEYYSKNSSTITVHIRHLREKLQDTAEKPKYIKTISPSCFYNAVTRLRKKACQIPDPVGKASTLDLTSHKQDVVQIAIEPESSPAGLIPDNGNRPMHLDNSHTIEIEADGLLIRMSNEIKPLLLKMLMDTLKESLC